MIFNEIKRLNLPSPLTLIHINTFTTSTATTAAAAADRRPPLIAVDCRRE
ncbi:hypothetical protein Scep_005765 [Stephania cephalantha]|uniref:Uncharacterized protein n=1 Tax=Stephania cephalantha TaxID=152367 RepID=A0AAP0Q0G4_9MAGN